jgi:hypothetical protein
VRALCVILWISAGSHAWAQVSANPYLLSAREKLQALDDEGALTLLDQAKHWPGNSESDLAQVYLCMGLAHAALAHEEKAIEMFRNALILDAGIHLPDDAAPRVHEWWHKAGGASETAAAPPSDAPVLAPVPSLAPVTTVVTVVQKEPSRVHGVTITGAVTGGLGLLGLAGGAYLGSEAQSLRDQAQQSAGTSVMIPTYRNAVSDAQKANALYAVGAGLLAVGSAVLAWGIHHGS